MVIKETPVFSRQIDQLLEPESYRLLQLRLVADPRAGDLIRGTGGLRKIRWEGSGRGRSGGIRVIYYWAGQQDIILMLLAYEKKGQDDLTPAQRKILSSLVKEEFK